ncbi:MAG: Gldg family protein [Alphaproteobacteria bacterium]|nr:Gldg family protein [Alphaproteobacteria bacterium]
MDASNRTRGLFASRRAVAVAALICIGLILISANIVIGRWGNWRLDLTADRLYTLSPGTLHTLARIDEPITLRFYYSNRLGNEAPAYGVYAQRVRELLAQYVAAAKGKLRLEAYDPQPFSNVEDRAMAFGLQGVPLDTAGDRVYFGLAATNSTDDQQIISFFQPERERFLEYDLTKLIHSLAVPKKSVIGLISSLPLEGDMMAMMRGRPSHPTVVLEQLRQLDKVETLGTDIDAIPADVDVLMLVHPQNLPPKTLFAIDQFVLNGGKALIFVDPHSEMQETQPNGTAPPGVSTGSDLVPLFRAWGFKMLPGVVAGDRSNAQQVEVPVPGRGEETIDYIAWLDLKAANLNRSDMITADLSHLTMASAGILEPLPGAKTNFEPLVWTSPDSTKIAVEKLGGLPDVAGLLADFKPDDKSYTLAAHVTGPAQSAFPAGPPDAAKPKMSKPGDIPAAQPPTAGTWLKQARASINVVVVADSDILDDRTWVQSQNFFGQRVIVPFANNGDFVADAVDVLAGGEDLVGLRSRGTAARPFEVVDEFQRKAQARYSAEEHALEQKLKATEAKLAGLTGKDQTETPANLSPEQTKAVAQFRLDILQTRRQLRDVQAALRSNIQRLQEGLEFLDIAMIPIIVAVIAVVVGVVRMRRRRRRIAEV